MHIHTFTHREVERFSFYQWKFLRLSSRIFTPGKCKLKIYQQFQLSPEAHKKEGILSARNGMRCGLQPGNVKQFICIIKLNWFSSSRGRFLPADYNTWLEIHLVCCVKNKQSRNCFHGKWVCVPWFIILFNFLNWMKMSKSALAKENSYPFVWVWCAYSRFPWQISSFAHMGTRSHYIASNEVYKNENEARS